MPTRKRKAAARAAAATRRAVQQQPSEASDVEMVDAPASPSIAQEEEDAATLGEKNPDTEQQNEAQSPGNNDADDNDTPDQAATRNQEQEQDKEREVDGDDEQEPTGPSTPLPDSEEPSRQETPLRTPGRVSSIPIGPRKRRPGRPPKNRPPDWEAPETNELRSEPRKRGRGRPSAGGRWSKARGGPSHVTQVPVDKEGNMMDVINDEVDLPEDPEGEKKVNKLGTLLGGREYRVRTFTILDRGERQYMLSTEPARCIGFRDSYLFFQKHKLLYKIIIDDDEKRNLIERDIIPHSYKGRAIGVVTARSVFREFGAKIIIGGKKIIDDYDEKAARERGDVEGELAVPEDILPRPGEQYDRNRYVAWHGASSVYHSGAPSVPMPAGKAMEAKKKKVIVTGDNWMVEHARASSTFNLSLANFRRESTQGTYDIHTNAMLYPKDTQPSYIRFERVPEQKKTAQSSLVDSAIREVDRLNLSTSKAPVVNGIMPEEDEDDTNSVTEVNGNETQAATTAQPKTVFPPVAPLVARHFQVRDIHYETPTYTAIGAPGPNGSGHANGLVTIDPNTGVPTLNMDSDILRELPPECKDAYIEAALKEYEWKRYFVPVGVNRGYDRPRMSYAYHQ